MTDVKQMSRQELEKAKTLEALNEILTRNSRVAAAMKIIREHKEGHQP